METKPMTDAVALAVPTVSPFSFAGTIRFTRRVSCVRVFMATDL